MTTTKIAITVPPDFLKSLDAWAKKKDRSRSRFIVEEMRRRIKTLEDEEITRLYNEAYSDSGFSNYDRQLAEELLSISAIEEESEDEW